MIRDKRKTSIRIMSMYDAEEYVKKCHSNAVVVISLTSQGGYKANIIPSESNKIKDILHLKINDTDIEELGGMTKKQALKIKDFVIKYKDREDINSLIVHCEAGRSRSAGVAGAIMKYLWNDDSLVFEDRKYTPNMLCYKQLLNELMAD